MERLGISTGSNKFDAKQMSALFGAFDVDSSLHLDLNEFLVVLTAAHPSRPTKPLETEDNYDDDDFDDEYGDDFDNFEDEPAAGGRAGGGGGGKAGAGGKAAKWVILQQMKCRKGVSESLWRPLGKGELIAGSTQ